MRKLLSRMWRDQEGVLSFEWTMLASLLTVGVVAGVAAVRDSVIDEMADLTYAMTSLDQSYRIQGPLVLSVHTPDFYGSGGSYRVNEFRGDRSVSQGLGVMGSTGSTAAGSLFLDAPSRIVRSRLPEQRAPADGQPLPGTPIPPPEAHGFNLPEPSLEE